jgi:hypothetical protein
MTAEQMREHLRKKMKEIHDITQDTMQPAWQALQNIAATASSALSSTHRPDDIETLEAEIKEMKNKIVSSTDGPQPK